MTFTLVFDGVVRSFSGFGGLAVELGLHRIDDEDRSAILSAHEAGFPLHACIDPFAEDVWSERRLLLAPTASQLEQLEQDAIGDI